MKGWLVGIALVCVAGGAMAVEPMLWQGTREVGASGSIDDDGDDLGFSINGRYGYFLCDGIEAGGYGGLGVRGSDHKNVNMGVFGEYNFDVGRVLVPYAGGGLGLTWMDSPHDDDTFLELRGWGGGKYFFIDYAALTCELLVKFATEDIYNRSRDGIDWAIQLGTRWFF